MTKSILTTILGLTLLNIVSLTYAGEKTYSKAYVFESLEGVRSAAEAKSDTDMLIPEIDLSELNTAPIFQAHEYKSRLDSLENKISLDYNAYVQRYIDVYAFKRREQVSRMLGLAEYYFPMFEKVFADNKLPLEFKYLAIVESALSPFAVSRVGATGIWQFMHTTGKAYNLQIDNYLDERKDPYKATVAAAKYFKDMYARYGDWLLVIAAYNCGPGNVNKAIKRAGGKYNFWAIRNYLPSETRGYVPAFIAATYIMNFAEEHNLYPSYPEFSFATDTVMINKPLSFMEIASAVNVSLDELKILNPSYKKEIVPAFNGNSRIVYVPATKKELIVQAKPALYKQYDERNAVPVMLASADSLKEPVPADNTTAELYYTVRTGDNLNYIAQWYNCSVTDLKAWNGMKSTYLNAGQKLKIMVPSSKVQVYEPLNTMSFAQKQSFVSNGRNVASVKQPVKKYVYHKVQRGDTLWTIAQKYEGVTVDQLKRINNIRNARNIKPGQLLKVSRG